MMKRSHGKTKGVSCLPINVMQLNIWTMEYFLQPLGDGPAREEEVSETSQLK